MTVSVIIPTYNGAHKIIHTLHCLENQTFQNFETIVVVDGSTDNTLEVLDSSHFQLENLIIVSQENRGRASVRNRGAEAAKGKLLVFFDDDMRPEPDCVVGHINHHRLYPGSIAVGTQLNDWKKATTEMQRYRCHYSRKWEENLIGKDSRNSVKLDKEHLYITAANFSLVHNDFKLLGGFDERLNDAEDYDLAIRAYQKNILIYYVSDAHAWHDEQYSLATYIDRRKGYATAHQLLQQLKPTIYREHTKRKIVRKGGLKKAIFWLFSFSAWVDSVDRLNLFRWLPAAWRFKLYDLIITSRVIYFPH